MLEAAILVLQRRLDGVMENDADMVARIISFQNKTIDTQHELFLLREEAATLRLAIKNLMGLCA